ncbi:MAG: SPOR domain-containing protein, partial [Zetaproteobacteria bacterium]
VAGGKREALGQLENGYIEVPKGEHALTFRCSAPVYARLLRLEDPDYLFPILNGPKPDERSIRQQLETFESGNPWSLTQEDLVQAMDAKDIGKVELAAMRLARDNSHSDGGLLAASLLRRKAEQQRQWPDLRKDAELIMLRHTFYRDLRPEIGQGTIEQAYFWFVPKQLADPAEVHLEQWFEPEMLRAGLMGLPGAYFTLLTHARHSADKALTYHLPVRSAASRIRIAWHAEKGGNIRGLWLQMDDRPPAHLQLVPMTGALRFAPGRSEAALDRLAEMFGKNRASTLDGPFSAFRESGSLVEVATAELELPSEVSRIRLWSDSQQQGEGWVALQYRASSIHRLSETAYRGLLDRMGSKAFELFQKQVRALAGPFGRQMRYAVQVGAYVDRERAKQRARKLKQGGFDAHLEPPLPGSMLIRLMVGESSSLEKAKRLQYELMRKGFTDAYVVEQPQPWRQASSQDDMPSAGNFSSSELLNEWMPLIRLMIAQNRLLSVPVSASRMMLREGAPWSASTRLSLKEQAQKAESTGDWLAALQHWGRLAAGSRGEDYRLAQLGRVRALEQLGEYGLAWSLQRALFLYADDPLLRQEAWKAIARQAKERHRMRAMLPMVVSALLRHGQLLDYQALVQALALSDESRMALELALMLPDNERPWEMMTLASYQLGWSHTFDESLQHLTPEQRALWLGYSYQREGRYDEAVQQWKQAGEPGNMLVRKLEQGRQIRNQLDARSRSERLRAMRQWWSWVQSQPGPMVWREMASAVVSSAGTELVNNLERGLVFYGARSEPGRPIKLRFFGPADLRLEARPLHPASGHHALDDWISVRENGRLRVVPVLGNMPVPSLELVGRPYLAGRSVPIESHFGPGLHEVEVSAERASMLVRVFVRRPATPLSVLPPVTIQSTLAAFQGSLGSRQGSSMKRQHLSSELGSLGGEKDRRDSLAVWLGSRQFDRILSWKPGEDASSTVEYMQALLWIKEHDAARAQRALSRGEALFAAHPDIPGMSGLHARLVAGTVWTPQRMVENSAGMHIEEVHGWQPESVRQRVRQTLMPPVSRDEAVMPGYQQIRIIMDNTASTVLHLNLGAVMLPLVEPLPMQIEYRLDEGASSLMTLDPEQGTRHVRIPVPAGRHFVIVRLRDPLPDQYLRVYAYEVRNGVRKAIALNFERSYYVATRSEPVVLNVHGPLWLRIEQRSHGRSRVSYKLIPSGWHRLRFKPHAGQEVRYRFAGRVLDKAAMARANKPRPLPAMVAVQPVPGPWLKLAGARPVTGTAKLEDGFDLGGQEDGTWSVGVSQHRRLNAAADRLQAAPVSNFTQLDIWHRYFDATKQRYARTQGLVRWHQHGDLVMGLTERIYMNEPDWPASLRIDGSLYAERFAHFDGGLHPGINRIEWSGTLQITALRRQYLNPKWYHVPLLTGFVRHVSMKGTPRLLPGGTIVIDPPPGLVGRIDTDVYTTYKERHRYGIGLADTLAYRPWLDTLLRVSAGWQGNENLLDTDHVFAALRWDQRLGDAQFNLANDWIRYFADRDRLKAATVSYLNLELLWDLWQENQTRWELSLDFRHYWTQTRENVGFIGLTVHFGEGRMYRDFMPGELDLPDFFELRQRRIPQTINNIYRSPGS